MEVREAIKRRVPVDWRARARGVEAMLRARRARAAFRAARGSDETWLDPAEISVLAAAYKPGREYSYADDVALARGVERARQLAVVVPAGTCIEVGAGDAMVSYQLAKMGFSATALDLADDMIDPRAAREGVELLIGDATAMPVADASFDLAFSYNSFEHFSDPESVLHEMIRVVKPGGAIVLSFGPLYFSPFGLHGYRTIPVPYAQLLWCEEDLRVWAESNDLRRIPFETLNGWSVRQFRELWKSVASMVVTERYVETRLSRGVELIRRFPQCFVSKTDTFDDLLVSVIDVTFRRR